jgi:hypothetical protein
MRFLGGKREKIKTTAKTKAKTRAETETEADPPFDFAQGRLFGDDN